jgi:hypothetical protein
MTDCDAVFRRFFIVFGRLWRRLLGPGNHGHSNKDQDWNDHQQFQFF